MEGYGMKEMDTVDSLLEIENPGYNQGCSKRVFS